MELADPKYKFDDTFTVKSMDNEKFQKVPRVSCEGQSFGASLEMDFYFESFSLKECDTFFMALTDSVSTVEEKFAKFSEEFEIGVKLQSWMLTKFQILV